MEDDTTVTEGSELSLTDRIASKFGLPSQSTESPQGEETPDPAADLAQIEVDGDLFQVPVKLKDAFLRNQDYTQKTQQLAEERKSIEHVRELAQQRQIDSSFQESVAAEQQEIAVIDAYLQQASKIDWSTMNMEQMFRTRAELDNVKERRSQLRAAVDGKRAQFNEQVKTKFTELRQKARELASKSISGFNEEMEKAVRAYGVSEGLTETEVDNVLLDPRSYKVLVKAMQYDKVKAGTQQVRDKTGKFLKPGAASERMPQKAAANLNYRKEVSAAKTSGEKALAIERRLAAMPMFSRGVR